MTRICENISNWSFLKQLITIIITVSLKIICCAVSHLTKYVIRNNNAKSIISVNICGSKYT